MTLAGLAGASLTKRHMRTSCSTDGCQTIARTEGLCHKCYNRKWHADRRAAGAEARRCAYTPEQVRDRNLRNLYPDLGGLVGFDAIVAAQGGVCAICHRPPTDKKRRLHVDHDHKTGRIRGLLCLHCNVMLGKSRDCRETLLSAVEYLDKSS